MIEGKKNDNEKIRMDLIPPAAIEALATVLTHGAKKYGDNNWMEGINFRRVYAATQRHLGEYRKGKYTDVDSGLPHLWLAFCELAFLIHYEDNLERYDRFNDFKDEWSYRIKEEI